MGNVQSDQSGVNWQFVGREEDLIKAKALLLPNRSLLVSGMKKIGKTRFMEELHKTLLKSEEFRDYNFFCKDFELEDIESGYTQHDWFVEIFDCIGAQIEKGRFQKKYTEQKIACQSCDPCKSGGDRCDKQNELIKSAINTLVIQLKKCRDKIIIFFDNVDMLMDSPLKDNFLYFHKKSLDCEKLKTVIASANKPKQTLNLFESLELKPLDNNAILKLLFITTEQRDNNDTDASDVTVAYTSECVVFKKENKPYIEAIVRLCEGLPLAATMSGLLLTEDYGLLTPKDLVEILICIRLKSLSPDNCPPDDRLDIYKNPMEQIKEVESFFNFLNDSMTGNSFTMEDAVAAAGDENMTLAMVKFKYIKAALDRSVMDIDEQRMRWHGIFRECQAALNTIGDIPSNGSYAETMVLKFMQENAEKAGIHINYEKLSDQRALEQVIADLPNRESTPNPVQESEEQTSDDLKMDQLKEEKRIANDNYLNTPGNGKNTKTSPIVEAHIEIGSCKDLQTPPDSEVKHNKVEARYSPVEESNSSDSNCLQFEYTNVRHGEQPIGSDFHFSSPPPYSSRSELHSARERYNNQTNQSIIYQRNSPTSEGVPPPSYSSTDRLPHHQNKMWELSGHNVAHALPQTYCGTQGIRSRSTSLVFPPGNTSQGTNREPEDCRIPNLSRTHSDPTCSRINSRNSLHCGPRREETSSINSSLTGPPAINYIPPNFQTFDTSGSNRHLNIDSNEVQFTNQRMNYLKENITDTPVETSISEVPVSVPNLLHGHSVPSSVGPAAISNASPPNYRLHSVMNSQLTSQTASKGQNDKTTNQGAKPKFQVQTAQKSSTTSRDRPAANKTGPTPIAVVSPKVRLKKQ